jgi:type I restriction enzyme, S subunit
MNNNNTIFKDSPLGKIPVGWEIKRVEEFAPLQRGFDLPVEKIIAGKYPVVFSNGILKFHNEFKALAPGVVTGRSGTIGKVTFVEQNYWPHNTSLWVTDFKGNEPKYVYYFYVHFDLSRFSSGSGVPTLNRNDVHRQKILLPPPLEQKAIAHLLGLMDSAINSNNQLIAKKELQKKWLMQNLLTGKKRVKNDELEIMNYEWKKIKLGDVFEFLKSYSISREGLTKSYKENLIYCIHYGDIHAFYETDFLDFSNQQNIPQIIDDNQIIYEKDYLKEGDIIMVDASEDYEGVGEVVEVVNLENKIAVGGLHTIVLRANSEIIAKIFCGYFFSSETVRNALRKVATGTSVYSVTKSQIHNLSFIIPNFLREQTAIAKVLQTADKEIQLLKTRTEKLREQKKGLMQVLLTGKKRLTIT